MFLSTSFAQEEASGLEIEEIIVTLLFTKKFEESLQDVPIAITAITEHNLWCLKTLSNS